ncbi:Hsp70 family protein [Clostridium sp.]|uniref:Hsp70 family protein n=1 Tax=Clostridium sp. TaxID=1506 RepID=UPI002FDF02F2
MYHDYQHHLIIGIDFGTIYNSVSKWNGKKAEIYGKMGEYIVPSAVCFNEGRFHVGNAALAKEAFYPENCISGIKGIIACGKKAVFLGNKEFSLRDICSVIFKYIYNNIKTTVPEDKFKCEGAVISVPCYFDNEKRNIIKEGAKLAGIEFVGIIEEPVAAALAYGMYLRKNKKREENVLVFDLGGGSFQVAVIKVLEKKDEIQFNVLASEGNGRLGGLDFDEELYNYIVKKESLDFSNYEYKTANLCRKNLMEEIVKAKELLSYDSEIAYIKIYNVPPGEFLDTTLTLEELNKCIEHHIEMIKNIMEKVIVLSGISVRHIHKIIKAGGSSKIKAVDSVIKDVLGEIETCQYMDYKEVVSNGAAIYAAYKTKNLLLDKPISILKDSMKKSLYFIWMIDCSGSMSIHNRLNYVKEGMMGAVSQIEEKCSLHDIIVNFGVIKFADTAAWSVEVGGKINDSIYGDINPGGITSLGSAINMLSSKLTEIKLDYKTLTPIIFLITDGMPTDNYEESVEGLLAHSIGKSAYKEVIALGRDVCEEYMCKFIDDAWRKPKRVLQKEHIVESICSQALNSVEYVNGKFIGKYSEHGKFQEGFSEKKIKGGLFLKTSENK